MIHDVQLYFIQLYHCIWSQPVGPLINATKSDWKWVGIGPPAALQLTAKSRFENRIILPSYHSSFHLDGDFSKGHCIISDDLGETWYVL